MNCCSGCLAIMHLDQHFDAIFDALEEAGIDGEPLAILRISLHNKFEDEDSE